MSNSPSSSLRTLPKTMSDALFTRSRPLFTDQGIARLKASTVAVVGLGGVGGAAAEALARSGIGHLVLIDHDVVEETNLNRQIIATHDAIGTEKTAAMAARVQAINPTCKVTALTMMLNHETKERLFDCKPDVVFDAIDMVTFKIDLVRECRERRIPLLTSCGQGNRLDPTAVRMGDLFNVTHDPLARVMRAQLRRAGIDGDVPCVYSLEAPRPNPLSHPASSPFVPPAAGLVAAATIVSHLIGKDDLL